LVLLVAHGPLHAFAAEEKPPATAAAQGKTTVLHTYGIWRFHCTLEPPVLASGQAVKLKYAWLNQKTPGPPREWSSPDFDDRLWDRGPVTLACKSALLARVCLRGKFTVIDPASVRGLALSVGYRGGLVVYVNGKEAHREHLAEGAALAEGPACAECRLTDFAIRPGLLRKGVNVIGLEVVRAAYPEQTQDNVYEENSCQILSAKLTCDAAAGLVPNAVRPRDFQVWNADPLAVDFDLDFGDRAEAVRPVIIAGARNGTFTGKVVAGCSRPIRNLKVAPAGLQGPGGSIPAAKLRIRYGVPWGDYQQVNAGNRKLPTPYPAYTQRLGALAEQPPAEFPVLANATDVYWSTIRPDAAQIKPVRGAVVPIWISVRVPAGVPAGEYAGSVRVEAEGEQPVQVPVELRVADWSLPDTQDFRTWVDMIQCPDTLALEYKVPLWSERHWELIAQSFKLIGETGSRTVYVPLIAHTNLGNEQSMVRWLRKGDKYDYDFSILERYLDVAEKNMGRPKLVIFVVWDVYMIPASDAGGGAKEGSRQKQLAEHVQKTSGRLGRGPMVTLLDQATGKTELVTLPPHFDPAASKPLWQPLFDRLLAGMRKRGLQENSMLGLQSDAWASKQEHQLFKDITGGLPWVVQSHEGYCTNWSRMMDSDDKLMHGISKIGYQARVWAVTFSDDNADRGRGYEGGMQSHRGWSRPDLVAQFDRFSREFSTNVYWQHLAETAVTGSQRGNGRLGGDYWKAIKNKNGKRVARAHERYPESTWLLLTLPESLLAPGPEGPAASDELEAYRQGVQECEARIVIERALGDKDLKTRLGPDLVRRCEEYLQERHLRMWLSLSDLQLFYDYPGARWGPHYMASAWRGGSNVGGSHWFLASGWQLGAERLYSLAGEVARKIAGKLPE
jgi:hypothetical protein